MNPIPIISHQPRPNGCRGKWNGGHLKNTDPRIKALYVTWMNMKRRCVPNTRAHERKYYFERGIKVCERWINDFIAFANDVGFKPDGTSLDRIDNNGNYEPGNVRWATSAEQARNTSQNHWIELNGRNQTLTDWAKEYGVPAQTVSHRIITQKWDALTALTTPPNMHSANLKFITVGNETMHINAWARKTGVKRATISYRLKSGWATAAAIFTPVAK